MSPQKEKITLTLRLKSSEEHDSFKRTAEAEGFSTVSSWMMYHLRARVRETLGVTESPEQTTSQEGKGKRK